MNSEKQTLFAVKIPIMLIIVLIFMHHFTYSLNVAN
jgi:hypothetical protein